MKLYGARYDAFERILVGKTPVGFTATIRGDRHFALVTVETAAVRFRFDGTGPTADLGHALAVDDSLELDRADQCSRVMFIGKDGTPAILQCSYGN